MVLERFWRGFGEDLGRFGEVLERISRKGLEEAPSPGKRSRILEKAQRGPKTQKRLGEAQKAQKRPK